MADATLFFPRADAERLEPYLLIPHPSPRNHQLGGGGGKEVEEEDADRADERKGEGEGANNGTSRSHQKNQKKDVPFVTLTYAASLDSALSLGPGLRTTLSGPESKAMTHYLRSRHDAILVGVGTAIADDPGLNCRIDRRSFHPEQQEHQDKNKNKNETTTTTSDADAPLITTHQPRPLILDPSLRWDIKPNSKVLRLARQGQGLAPFILTCVQESESESDSEDANSRFASLRSLLEPLGGKLITIPTTTPSPSSASSSAASAPSPSRSCCDWLSILRTIRSHGLESVMVEGGAQVIDQLLTPGPEPDRAIFPDAVIVTVAPTWLGKGSVVVSPVRREEPVRLKDTAWIPLGQDVVLCGRIARPGQLRSHGTDHNRP